MKMAALIQLASRVRQGPSDSSLRIRSAHAAGQGREVLAA
jgi:hypothetical protein